jgi:GT2 family glycosyltransferase
VPAVVDALADLDAVCGRVVAEGAGHLSVLDDPSPCDYSAATDPADLGHGANLAVRRSALEAVGGWDEQIGPGTPWPGAEDKDLLLRVLAVGGRAGYRPEPAVRHLQWRSRRQALSAELGYGRGLGALAALGRGPRAAIWLRRSLRATATDLRNGYQYGVAAGLLRSAGIAWGALLAHRRLR